MPYCFGDFFIIFEIGRNEMPNNLFLTCTNKKLNELSAHCHQQKMKITYPKMKHNCFYNWMDKWFILCFIVCEFTKLNKLLGYKTILGGSWKDIARSYICDNNFILISPKLPFIICIIKCPFCNYLM